MAARNESHHNVAGHYVYEDWSESLPELRDKKAIERERSLHPIILRFPTKLNKMLDDEGLSGVIEWMPHGRSWIIRDRDQFVNKALPAYFEHKNFNSFNRLVNAWGFRRVTSGIDSGSYYHELFLQGMPHLHIRMRRLRNKRKKEPVEEDYKTPNFYEMTIQMMNKRTERSQQRTPQATGQNNSESQQNRPESKGKETRDVDDLQPLRPAFQQGNHESPTTNQTTHSHSNTESTQNEGLDHNHHETIVSRSSTNYFLPYQTSPLTPQPIPSNAMHAAAYFYYAFWYSMWMNQINTSSALIQGIHGQHIHGIVQNGQESHSHHAMPRVNNPPTLSTTATSSPHASPPQIQINNFHQSSTNPFIVPNTQIQVATSPMPMDMQREITTHRLPNIFWFTDSAPSDGTGTPPSPSRIIYYPPPCVPSSANTVSGSTTPPEVEMPRPRHASRGSTSSTPEP